MIIWDIETGPLPLHEIEATMPDFQAPHNLKDPAKIGVAIDMKREEYIDRAALSPITGQVLAIGYYVTDYSGHPSDFFELQYRREFINEKELIESFFDRSTNYNYKFCGFNTHSFDIPFLIRRAWKLGITVPKQFLGRYMPDNHIDLMKIWSCGIYGEKISLNNLAKYFGLHGKDHSGEYFYQQFNAGNIDAAMEYLKNDLLLTREVASRLGIC